MLLVEQINTETARRLATEFEVDLDFLFCVGGDPFFDVDRTQVVKWVKHFAYKYLTNIGF